MWICFIWLDFKGFVHKCIIYAGYGSDHDHEGGHVGCVKFIQKSEKTAKIQYPLCCTTVICIQKYANYAKSGLKSVDWCL